MFAKWLGWWAWHAQKRTERGQGLVEYALILVLVSITVIALLSFLGTTINEVFEDVADALGGQTITIVHARHRPTSSNGDIIEIKALHNGGWDPNVTLEIWLDGNFITNMNAWNNNTAYGRYIPASNLSCPCTFTIISNPGGKTKSVLVNTNYD